MLSLRTGMPFMSEQGILDLGSLEWMHRLVYLMSSSIAMSVMLSCHMSRGAELQLTYRDGNSPWR